LNAREDAATLRIAAFDTMYKYDDYIVIDYQKNYKTQLYKTMSNPLLIRPHTKTKDL